jgi:ABC-type glycerol-3-phosphate transport system substrate-binding protein
LNKRHLLVICALLVSALALVACGSSGSSDEAEIEEAIETSATASDPANCTKLETLNFSEQSSGESGKAATEACEEEAKDPEGKADSVEVSEVEVDGEKATAQAAISGGSFDGQAVVLALVKEGDQWKLDEITEFAKFDQGAIAQQFKTQLEKGGEVEAETISCIVEGIEEAPQEEIEEAVLSGDSSSIEELAESCV